MMLLQIVFLKKYYLNQKIVFDVFTADFIKNFCDNGVINWPKLVQFNSSI